MFEFLWNLASFIVALGLLITVHEYGHFWVARKCGVKVQKFSIGFGKTLLRRHDKYGTEYVIAAIPLGGYVKMLDSRVDEVSDADKPYAFDGKSVYQRIAIVSAGPIANFLFAIVAFYLMFLIGMTSVKPVIGDVEQNSIAAQAGISTASEIVAVGGDKTVDWQAVNMALVSHIGDPQITIQTKQADSSYVKTHQLDTRNWQFEPSKVSAMDSLGIIPFRPEIKPIIGRLVAEQAADKAGIQVGDEIIAVDGQKLDGNWQKFVDTIVQNPNRRVAVTINRQGVEQTIQVLVGTQTNDNGLSVGYLGLSPTLSPWPDSHKVDISYGPLEALPKALSSTWNLITLSFDMIGKLLTGHVSVDNLSGPIAIAQGAGSSAGIGLVYFLSFLALISINLGIINLLPLPILDGGHLLYYAVELVTGKPVSEKVQEIGFKIGALVLLTLMCIAIVNDLARL
ncbi:sigma E protease regulator RseP [Thalassotalea ponticola]|uniref:sigma E protease regulator RseP n=1 Tax=Thalassotalea ponticola TaxID=1523392 RepID=UPI0025B49122|nr:sigma E protease regulator RseP [Thalassotalea ponticola]MDN3652548.1 sigma E protease regulator RseP [Thalassotalea ponticola]